MNVEVEHVSTEGGLERLGGLPGAGFGGGDEVDLVVLQWLGLGALGSGGECGGGPGNRSTHSDACRAFEEPAAVPLLGQDWAS